MTRLTHRRLQRLGAAATVAVLALGASACGGSDASSSDAKQASSSKTASSGDELVRANFIRTITAAQTAAGTSHVTMDIGVGGQSVKAEGDVKVGKTIADTAMTLTMDMGSAGMGSLKMVLVDQKFFLNFGQLTDDKFAKIDLTDTNSPFAKQFGSITDQLDPSKQLEQFEGALTSFKKAGSPEKIDGVDAQPYELVLDTSKIKELSELSGSAGAAVPKELSYTMYVGPDNLLRRLTADVSGSKVKVDYTRWGKDVEVEAPAAGDVTDKDLSQLGAPSA